MNFPPFTTHQGATEQTWTNHPLIRTHHVQIYKWLSQIYKKDPIWGDSFRFLFLLNFLHNPVLIPFSVFVWSNLKQELPPAEAEKYPQDKGTQNFSDPNAWSRGQISCGLSSNCRNWIFGSQLFGHCGLPIFSNPNSTQLQKWMFIPMAKQMWKSPFFQTFQFSREVSFGANFQQHLHVFRPFSSGLFEVKRSEMWNDNGSRGHSGVRYSVVVERSDTTKYLFELANWDPIYQMLEIYLGRSFQKFRRKIEKL